MLRKLLKASVGIGVLGLAGYSLASSFFQGPEAVLNGRVVAVRAPVTGYISIDALHRGMAVHRGDELARLKITSAATEASTDARAIEQARVRVHSVESEITALRLQVRDLRKLSDEYRQARIKQLETKLLQASAGIDAAHAKEQSALTMRDRQQKLYAGGLAIKATIEAAEQSAHAARKERAAAEQEQAWLRAELAAAQNGTFVIDGYNDSSYARQRADQLSQRIIELQAEAQQQQGLLASLTRSTNPTSFTRKISDDASDGDAAQPSEEMSAIASPASGIVWRVAGGDQFVRAGEEVATVVDCSQLFAIVTVADHGYQRIQQGTRASFQEDDDSGTLQGTVVWAGIPDRTPAADLSAAIEPQMPTNARYELVVNFDATPKATRDCLVGKPGHVRFETATPTRETLEALLQSVRRSQASSAVRRLLSEVRVRLSEI